MKSRIMERRCGAICAFFLLAFAAPSWAFAAPEDEGTAESSEAEANQDETRTEAIERARQAFAEMDEERDRVGNSGDSYIPQDTQPSIVLFHEGDRWATMGASVQLWAVPMLGEDALLTNGDPANATGFRLRRLRFGVEGALMKDVVFGLELDHASDEMVHSAEITWIAHAMARLSLGTGKVPYSRSALDSSSQLRFVDRPFSTGDVAIGHRLGLTIEGRVAHGALGYVGGVYNASEGFADGNVSGGLLYGGRLESAPLGALATLRPHELRVQLGGGAVMEDGPTVNTFAWSGDLHAEMMGVRLRGEYLFDRRTPDAIPQVPSTLEAEVERTVMLGEATAFVYGDLLELAGRYERYDNNKSYEDFGDQQVMTCGMNLYLQSHGLKAQVNYILRDELEGRDIDNDALVVSVVGAL